MYGNAFMAFLKRVYNVLFVVVLIVALYYLLVDDGYHFSPQYLVDNSSLKGREFAAEVKKITSPKLGIKAYLLEERSNPLVNVSFDFRRAGRAYEPQNRQGLNRLLSQMLLAGAGKYDVKAFQKQLNQKAISLSFSSDADDFYGALRFVAKDADTAANLLNLALTKPQFKKDELKKARQNSLETYARAQENPESWLSVQTSSKLFGAHPYGRNPYGSPQTLKQVTAADMRGFMRRHFTRDNLLVGLSGDISAEQAAQLLDKMFAGLPAQNKGSNLPEVKIDYTVPLQSFKHPSQQTLISFFAPAPTRSDADFYPIELALDELAGGSLSSRFHRQAREAEGLTYGAYAYTTHNDKMAQMIGYSSATPDKVAALLAVIRHEWQKLGDKGLSESELERVKKRFIGANVLRFADSQNIANTLVMMQKFNLGADFLRRRNDYIRNVNLDDVNTAVKKYFSADNLRFFELRGLTEMETEKDNGKDRK